MVEITTVTLVGIVVLAVERIATWIVKIKKSTCYGKLEYDQSNSPQIGRTLN